MVAASFTLQLKRTTWVSEVQVHCGDWLGFRFAFRECLFLVLEGWGAEDLVRLSLGWPGRGEPFGLTAARIDTV